MNNPHFRVNNPVAHRPYRVFFFESESLLTAGEQESYADYLTKMFALAEENYRGREQGKNNS
jgi:hypothetical protein